MLVIGARGFLGAHLMRASASLYDVVSGNRVSTAPMGVPIDITRESSVDSAFQATRPDVVLLLAALSDIDQCETDQEHAYAVNVIGAKHVANACARTQCRLLFTSSAAVFDGCKHGYTEDDLVSPINFYGQTKAMAETTILGIVPSAVIMRIALAIGFALTKGTNSLLDGLAERWALGGSVEMLTFEYRNPIDAVTLSEFILRLLNNDAQGVFHIGAKDPISRYELGMKLANRMNYSGRVLPQAVLKPGRAPRGPDHFLMTNKIEAFCSMPVPTSEQVIERCFDGIA
jgi:dTDP-4-dehydrorhamnose reductase